MNNTEKIINRIEAYLSFVRYKYSSEEKLARLKILEDYYKTKNVKSNTEKFNIIIESAESLKSGDLVLPLKVRGIFLTEGRPQFKYYTAEELKKACDNPINQNFKICLDHKDKEIASIVGAVEKIYYDELIKGIRWEGHINSEVQARNILDGMVKQVSVTVYSVKDFDERLGVVGKDLTFKELSLIEEGACKDNSIEPVL